MTFQFFIEEVKSEADYTEAAKLFKAYADSLAVALCFQNFDAELANLGRAYPPPDAAIFLARNKGLVAGCCAIRPLADVDYTNACEMKRLYVLPAFRGLGLGRELAEKAMGFAKDAGYDSILLDTLDEMETARSLYQELGFSEVEPYYHNPIPGAHYLRATF
jgi:putative acetyltransferase